MLACFDFIFCHPSAEAGGNKKTLRTFSCRFLKDYDFSFKLILFLPNSYKTIQVL